MSQPVFLVSFCISGFFANLCPLVIFGPYNQVNCTLRYVFPNIILTVYFGALVVKLYRVFVVLNNENGLKRIKVTPIMVTRLLGVWLMIDAIVIGLYAWSTEFWKVKLVEPDDTTISGLDRDMYDKSVREDLLVRACDSPQGRYKSFFMGGSLLSHLSLLVTGCYFSLKVSGRSHQANRKEQVL